MIINKIKQALAKLTVKKDKNTLLEGNNYVGKNTRVLSTQLGKHSYIGSNSDLSHCKIGCFTSIGSNVSVINGFHPTDVFVSTHPAFYSINNRNITQFVNNQKFEEYRFVEKDFYVVIGNDCWVGNNVIILAGVKVGDGAIIGSGSIITKDVEDYGIYAGVPAKCLRYRFSKDDVSFIKKTKWWKKDDKWLKEHSDSFENIESFKEHIINEDKEKND